MARVGLLALRIIVPPSPGTWARAGAFLSPSRWPVWHALHHEHQAQGDSTRRPDQAIARAERLALGSLPPFDVLQHEHQAQGEGDVSRVGTGGCFLKLGSNVLPGCQIAVTFGQIAASLPAKNWSEPRYPTATVILKNFFRLVLMLGAKTAG